MVHTGGLGNTITKFQTSGALETVIREFDSQYISMTARETGHGFRFSRIFYHTEYDKVPSASTYSGACQCMGTNIVLPFSSQMILGTFRK